MVTGLHLEDIREEVRTKADMKCLNNAWLLRLATGKVYDSELLIGFQFDKVGAEDDTRLLALIVINLDGRVIGATVCYEAGLITLGLRSLKADQFLDHLVKRHLPQLLVGFKHVGFAAL